MSTSMASHDDSGVTDRSQHFPKPKRADTNITNKDVTGLSTDEQILHELRQLNSLYRIQAELAVEEPLKTQALWNFLLQAFGLVVGTLFGVFAILAWKAADEANNMANSANQIALAAYCQSQTDDVCLSVQNAASQSVFSYASAFYDITPDYGGPTSAATTSVSTTVITSTSTVTSASSGTQPNSQSTPNFGSTASSSSAVTTSSSTVTPTNGANPTSGTSNGSASGASASHVGAIVGGVIGGLVGLVLIGYLPWLTFRARKRRYDNLAPLIEHQQRWD